MSKQITELVAQIEQAEDFSKAKVNLVVDLGKLLNVPFADEYADYKQAVFAKLVGPNNSTRLSHDKANHGAKDSLGLD